MSPSAARYSTIAVILHWLIAIALVSMVFIGWRMEDLRDALFAGEVPLDTVTGFYNWHKTIGILILVFSLARLFWRFTHPVPPLPETMKPWEAFAARGAHIAFYVIMIGMPIGGYVVASAYGDSFPILFANSEAMSLPKLPVPQSDEFREFAGSAHGAGGWVILVLLALHAGAALKHHFVDKDDVLARMIPILKR